MNSILINKSAPRNLKFSPGRHLPSKMPRYSTEPAPISEAALPISE